MEAINVPSSVDQPQPLLNSIFIVWELDLFFDGFQELLQLNLSTRLGITFEKDVYWVNLYMNTNDIYFHLREQLPKLFHFIFILNKAI